MSLCLTVSDWLHMSDWLPVCVWFSVGAWLPVSAWIPVGRELGRETLGKGLVRGACFPVVVLEGLGVTWVWE